MKKKRALGQDPLVWIQKTADLRKEDESADSEKKEDSMENPTPMDDDLDESPETRGDSLLPNAPEPPMEKPTSILNESDSENQDATLGHGAEQSESVESDRGMSERP